MIELNIQHLTFRKWILKIIFVWFFFFHHTPCYRIIVSSCGDCLNLFFLRTFLYLVPILSIFLIIVKLSQHQWPYPSISLIWFRLGTSYNKIYISSASILRFPFSKPNIGFSNSPEFLWTVLSSNSFTSPMKVSVIMLCLTLIPILSNLKLWHLVCITLVLSFTSMTSKHH